MLKPHQKLTSKPCYFIGAVCKYADLCESLRLTWANAVVYGAGRYLVCTSACYRPILLLVDTCMHIMQGPVQCVTVMTAFK